MSTDLHDIELRDAVVCWTQDTAPPAFDIAAIRRRGFRLMHPAPRSRRFVSPRAAIVICVTVGTLLAAAPSIPAIIGSVSRTFHAFAIGDGKIQTARTRAATLEQARKDMPFAVLTPAGLPGSLQVNLTEVYPSSRRADAQLWFDFSGTDPRIALTILEMSASSRYATPMNQAAPPPHEGAPSTCVSIKIAPSGTPLVRTMCEPPAVAGHGHAVITSGGRERGASLNTVHMVAGKGAKMLSEFRPPMRFVAHGTLVIVFDPAAVLSREQIRALRAAMSR